MFLKKLPFRKQGINLIVNLKVGIGLMTKKSSFKRVDFSYLTSSYRVANLLDALEIT